MGNANYLRLLKVFIYFFIIAFLALLLSNCGAKNTESAGEEVDSTSVDSNSLDSLVVDSVANDLVTFCCTNHNPSHCGRGDDLIDFTNKYGCTF